MLLDYESDALAAEKAGDNVQIVYPKQTILIQTPIAVTAKSAHQTQAKAFLAYQWSPAGQTIWAQQGYRPVLTPRWPSSSRRSSRRRRSCSRSTYLGGWTKVKKEFFDPASGSITKIEQAAGVPTASS